MPPVKGDGYRRLGDVVPGVLARSTLSEGLRRQKVLDRWEEIVGPLIAAHSKPVAIEGGVLMIQVESSVWAQELAMLRPEIQRALEQKLGPGSIRDVRFHSGRI